MSLNPQALQKLLLEMDNQLNKSRAELSMCNASLDRVDTNLKIVKSTRNKLNKLTKPGETVWKGSGRAFFEEDVSSYIEQLEKDEKDFLETEKSLKTKKHYLETTLTNTVKNMTDIVGKK